MADNILRGVVVIDTKGVGQSATQVSSAVSKMEGSLKKVAPTSNQATTALVNLSRVAQDAPFGFIGIANNLDPLLQSFQRLKAETGSTGGALKSLGSVLTGPAGLGLALSVVSSAIIAFGDKLFGTKKNISDAEIETGKFSNALKQLKTDADNVKTALDFENTVQKLALQLSGLSGARLSAANFGVDAVTNSKLIEDRTGKIIQLERERNKLVSDRIAVEKEAARITGQVSNLGKLFLQFGQNIPAESAGKLTTSEKALLDRLNATNDEIKKLSSERAAAFRELGAAPLRVGAAFSQEVKTGPATIKPDKLTIEPILPVQIRAKGVQINDVSLDQTDVPVPSKPATTNNNIEAVRQQLLDLQKVGFFVGESLSNVFTAAFDAIGSGKSAIQAVGEAVKSLVVQLVKAAIQAAITSIILNALAPGLGKAAGGFSGIFGNLLGLGGKRAGGGPVSGGASFLVGENGPEIFRPGTTGSIIPNGNLGSFGGGGLSGMMGRVVFEISANKLIGVMANGNRSQAILV